MHFLGLRHDNSSAHVGWGVGSSDPGAFATRAKTVLKRGFNVLKLDIDTPRHGQIGFNGCTDESEITLMEQKVKAARDKIGPGTSLATDCHWKFSPTTAFRIARDSKFNLWCLEYPVAYDNAEALLARWIRQLVTRHGAQVIYFTDDNFGAKATWLDKFTTLMKKEFGPRQIEYNASMHIDAIGSSSLKDLRDSGLRTVFHGIESGSPRQWKMLRKNFDPRITRQSILDLVRKEVETGIVPMYSFMMGLPNETEVDLDETLSLCQELAELGSIFSLQVLAPNEGTALFEDYGDLIGPFDLYNELGESENLSPELRTVFGESINEFRNCMPDFRLVKPSMPLSMFKKKCSSMIQAVTRANESNIPRIYDSRLKAAGQKSSSKEQTDTKSLVSILRRSSQEANPDHTMIHASAIGSWFRESIHWINGSQLLSSRRTRIEQTCEGDS